MNDTAPAAAPQPSYPPVRRVWTYRQADWNPEWWYKLGVPYRGGDEWGRHTVVVGLWFVGYVVWAYRTCWCQNCHEVREQTYRLRLWAEPATDTDDVDAAIQDIIRAHTAAWHPGRGCVENERGECADRFGDPNPCPSRYAAPTGVVLACRVRRPHSLHTNLPNVLVHDPARVMWRTGDDNEIRGQGPGVVAHVPAHRIDQGDE